VRCLWLLFPTYLNCPLHDLWVVIVGSGQEHGELGRGALQHKCKQTDESREVMKSQYFV
jgi:hypothetical protein